MQICGQEVNIEEIKGKAAELQSLMSDPEVLASIESKVAEMNEKLNSFKPEIPEVPSLQEALSELNAELSSAEFAEKLKKVKSDFGEAVDDLPEILNKINPRLNGLLNELPDSKDLTAVLDGSLIGEALIKAQASIAEAELKLQQKLTLQGKPVINTATICAQCPNIEVETKTIEVEEIRTKIIRGIPIKETVTVQKEVKQKVELPAEPVIPKTVPVKSEPKPVQKTVEVNSTVKSFTVLRRAQEQALKDYRETLKDPETARSLTYAQLFWYYIEIAKILGVTGSDAEILKKATERNMKPARFSKTLEEAKSLIRESDRKTIINSTRNIYTVSASGVNVKESFEQAVKDFYTIKPA